MPANLDERVHATFADIHRRAFLGDAAANQRLWVEVVRVRTDGPVTTMVLVTPWTINGLVFAPRVPAVVRVAGARRPVFTLDLPDLGRFGSVNLVPDVSGLPDQDRARSLAVAWAEPFRAAVADALAHPATADPDPTHPGATDPATGDPDATDPDATDPAAGSGGGRR